MVQIAKVTTVVFDIGLHFFLPSVFRRGNSILLCERAGEVRRVREAALDANLADGSIGCGQQMFCLFTP